MNTETYRLMTPYDKRTKIFVSSCEDGFKAVFKWNDDELDSERDFTVPMAGIGKTVKEAVGDLILLYTALNEKSQ